MNRIKLFIAIFLAVLSFLLCFIDFLEGVKHMIVLSALVSSSISLAIASIEGEVKEKQVYEIIIGIISIVALLIIPIFILWFSTINFAV